MKSPKDVLKATDKLNILKEHTIGWHIACEAVASVLGDMQEMLEIFQWMNDNPGCHPNNMRAAAERMLDKFGGV
jgi:hypothetical protein